MKLLLLVLLVMPVAGQVLVSDPDPAGDVTDRPGGPILDVPELDLLDVVLRREGNELVLEARFAADVPRLDPGSLPEGREVRYVMLVTLDAEPGATVADGWDWAVACILRAGRDDLECNLEQGEGTLRGHAAIGDTLRARVGDVEGLTQPVVGAAASAVDAEGNVTAQDFTPGAEPRSFQPPEGDPVSEEKESPMVWWAVLGLVAVAWRKRS